MIKTFFLCFLFCMNMAFCDLIDRKVLQEKLREPPPQWMIEQIEEDLVPFKERGGIDQKMAKKAGYSHRKALNLVHVIIHSGRVLPHMNSLYEVSQVFIAALSALAKEVALPDMDFFFTQNDFYGRNTPLDADCPIFCVCKGKESVGGILVPSFNELVTKKPDDSLDTKVRQGVEQYPWKIKKAIGFWRGDPSDTKLSQEWDSVPRSQLVLLSQKFPQHLDAKFSYCRKPLLKQILQSKGLIDKYTPIQEHMAYKYLIDADGVSNGWSRCYWILLSNSLMFKHASPFMQWYYRLLTPWEHYVPVKRDFSDLIEKIDWAKNHDVEAKEISQKATALAEENLSCEMRLVYLYHALKAYASLLQD